LNPILKKETCLREWKLREEAVGVPVGWSFHNMSIGYENSEI